MRISLFAKLQEASTAFWKVRPNAEPPSRMDIFLEWTLGEIFSASLVGTAIGGLMIAPRSATATAGIR
jgi:hypothetical protein